MNIEKNSINSNFFNLLSVNLIDENCQNIVEELEKSDFKLYNDEIKNIFLLREKIFNNENIKQKFRLLLLKDLFLKVERQYLENLNSIDDSQAHQDKAPNQKEIFDYFLNFMKLIDKNSIFK